MKTNPYSMILFFLGISLISSGQVTELEKTLRAQRSDTTLGWKKGGITAFNLSQTSLTNWASGGQNSMSLNGQFNGYANFKSNTNIWDNSLDLGYGLLRQNKRDGYMKTDDKIDFVSKFGRKAYKNWYYSALLSFKTQMTPGYNYPNDSVKISDWLAPAYFMTAIGLDYKPDAYFSMFVAPVTAKITMVNDQALANQGAYGVEKAKYDSQGHLLSKGLRSRSEFGGYLRLIYTRNDFKSEFLKNLSFTSKLDLFSNYLHHPQNIDVSWENILAMKVNKYIVVTFNTHLIYDDDIKTGTDTNNDGKMDKFGGPNIQFKEILGVGLSYKF
jgi:hypothetical protein